MAAFFNRWPDVGIINYSYNASESINDTGRYDGKTGQGAAAFGKILTESDSFAECSVSRAFEFLYGRKMTRMESENKRDDMVAKFRDSNENLRTIMKAIVLSPEFLSGKNGGAPK